MQQSTALLRLYFISPCVAWEVFWRMSLIFATYLNMWQIYSYFYN
jgi:hypothetical protein